MIFKLYCFAKHTDMDNHEKEGKKQSCLKDFEHACDFGLGTLNYETYHSNKNNHYDFCCDVIGMKKRDKKVCNALHKSNSRNWFSAQVSGNLTFFNGL